MKKKDIILAGLLAVSVVFSLIQVNSVEALARKSADYGLSKEEIHEAVASVKAYQESQKAFEEAKAKGEAGDAISSVTMANGKTVVSSVPGCYNTLKLGGGCAISSTAASVREAAGETPYASIMDSHTGEAGKTLLNAFAGAVGGISGPILDINIGKYTAKGIEYPPFTLKLGVEGDPQNPITYVPTGLVVDLAVPTVPVGCEPVLLYYTPDGKVGISSQYGYGTAERGTSSASFIISEPQGVYMMAFVPTGSMANARFMDGSPSSFSSGGLGSIATANGRLVVN